MKTKLTPRTQDEIKTRLEARKREDVLGFEWPKYLEYLRFEYAQGYLKDDCTEGEWIEATSEEKPPVEKMKDYMQFAFEKAHGERGISANRSIMHMVAWAWLTGDDSLSDFVEEAFNRDYGDYGLDILRGICERLEIDPKDHGDF